MSINVAPLLEPLGSETSDASDPRDGETFTQLSAEIDKLTSLTAQSPPNWARVEQLGQDYLLKQSKDFLVASWLAEAWTHRYDFEGVAAGLTLLSGLVDQFWDTAVPPAKRLRGRINAMEWWTNRAADWVKKQTDVTLAPALSDRLKDSGKQLDEAIALHDPDSMLVSSLLSHLNRIPVQAPPPDPVQTASADASSTDATANSDKPASTTTAVPNQPASSGSALGSSAPPTSTLQAPFGPNGTIEIKSLDDLSGLLKPAQDYLGRIAPAIFAFDHTHPLSIHLTRFAARAAIAQMPPVTNGQTSIMPPPVAILDAYEKVCSSKNAEGLIEFCEARIRDYPFWLDLEYQCARGYSMLGASGTRMRQTVVDMVINFVSRLPDIEQYCFSDGMPFAAPDALAWIERCKAEGSGGAETDGLGQVKKQAEHLASEGKTQEAIHALQSYIGNSAARRDQFRARVLLVNMSLTEKVQAGNILSLAMPLVEECLQLELDQWEPELASQAWQVVARCAREAVIGLREEGTPSQKEHAQSTLDQALAHLARVDFHAATLLAS